VKETEQPNNEQVGGSPSAPTLNLTSPPTCGSP
jgi:hypothetical protein